MKRAGKNGLIAPLVFGTGRPTIVETVHSTPHTISGPWEEVERGMTRYRLNKKSPSGPNASLESLVSSSGKDNGTASRVRTLSKKKKTGREKRIETKGKGVIRGRQQMEVHVIRPLRERIRRSLKKVVGGHTVEKREKRAGKMEG